MKDTFKKKKDGQAAQGMIAYAMNTFISDATPAKTTANVANVASSTPIREHDILIDSGATDHMSPRAEMFISIDESKRKALGTATSGSLIQTKGTGDLLINGSLQKLRLYDALYEPSLQNTLM